MEKKNKSLPIILGVVAVLVVAAVIAGVVMTRIPSLSAKEIEGTEYTANVPESEEAEYSFYGSGATAGTSEAEDSQEGETADTGDSEYLCEYLTERAITDEEAQQLVKMQVDGLPEGKSVSQMLINEMYARHGYEFKDEAISAYFMTKSWYAEMSDLNSDMDAISAEMADYEKQNIDKLRAAGGQ